MWNFQIDEKYTSRTWFGHLAPLPDYSSHTTLRRRGAMAKITAKQPWMTLKYTGSSIVLGPNQLYISIYPRATEETTLRHRSVTAPSASQVQFQHIFSSVFIFLSCTAGDPGAEVFISLRILPFHFDIYLNLLKPSPWGCIQTHLSAPWLIIFPSPTPHHPRFLTSRHPHYPNPIPSTAEAPKLCFAFAKPQTHNSTRSNHHWGSHTSSNFCRRSVICIYYYLFCFGTQFLCIWLRRFYWPCSKLLGEIRDSSTSTY